MIDCTVDLDLYVASNNVLEVRGLKNNQTGQLDPTANVQFLTLLDSAGNQVTGQNWPKVLDPVVGQDGTYRGTLDATLAITHGKLYTGECRAIGSGGEEKTWFPSCRAVADRT